METKEILRQAYLWQKGDSAKVRLDLAVKAFELGDEKATRRHALMSLQYSVGIMSPIYAKAVRD